MNNIDFPEIYLGVLLLLAGFIDLNKKKVTKPDTISDYSKMITLLKKLGYKIIKSRGNGAFIVDEPNGGRITIFGWPRTDYRWLANMKYYKEHVYPDTSNYTPRRKNDTSVI